MWRRAEIGLALVLFAAVSLAVLAGSRGPRPVVEDEPPSTYLAGPGGSKALYEVTARLGVPVERRRTALFDLVGARRRPTGLAVLNPPEWLLSAELEQVVRFVREGGTLVAAGEGGGLLRCFGWSPEPVRRGRLDSLPVTAPAGVGRLPRARAILVPVDSAQDSARADRRFIRALREEGGCGRLAPAGVDTVLALRNGRPVILRLRYPGGGEARLIAETRYVRNRAWRDTDAPVVVAPLLVPARAGRMAWDEYHHGYGGGSTLSGAVLGWLRGSPAGWALLQIVAVALAALAVAAVRFGPPRPVIDRRRRSPLEHVDALAAGLEAAHGADTAVRLVVAGLRRRLSRTGQPPHGDPRQWLRALAPVLPSARGRKAAERLFTLIDQPGGDERVLAAAHAVEDLWEDLRPSTSRAAF